MGLRATPLDRVGRGAVGLLAVVVLVARGGAPAAQTGEPTPTQAPTQTTTPAAPDATGERAPDPVAARRDHEVGKAKLLAGEVGEAVDLLRSAHALDPRAAHIANDLGFALAKLGARREAEALYRRALALDPRRWLAYVNLLDLQSDGLERWQRQGEVLALAERALGLLREDAYGRHSIIIAAAGFERSVGRLAEARRRLDQLPAVGLAPQLRKRANDTLRAIEEDERALELADWPEPALSREDAATLAKAERHLLAGRAALAVDLGGGLLARHPTASAARYLRARALQALEKYDEATADLLLLLQLRPSHAGAWRLLGTILAEHGGTLQARRADEALAKALALEPSWHELRDLRRKLAATLASARETRSAPQRAAVPSERARALLEEAQRWIAHDVPSMATTVLGQALADSPGFVEAAASLFSIGGGVPPATVRALWNDGEGLARLCAELMKIRDDDPTVQTVRPWLDRAVELGAAEARFERALLHAREGDGVGALADLGAYVGSGVDPPRLAEARALRSSLEPAVRDRTPGGWARRQLLAGRPEEAARELGGPCRPGLTAEALLELGRIAEYQERTAAALACHRLALQATRAGGGERRAALDRIARIAAGLSDAEARRQARGLTPELDEARQEGVAAAEWALSRLAAAEERWDEAIALGERYLRVAALDDPLRGQVTPALQSLRRQVDERRAAQAARVRTGLAALAALLLLGAALALVGRLRGRTVARALVAVPDIYPEVARVTAQIRHDILKHRASALGLLASPDAPGEEIARALLEPIPASAAVAAAFADLRRAAGAAGVALRPLGREPVFGPLHRALARAETLLAATGWSSPAARRELGALDRDLRERHGPALAALLTLAPRTRLDPARVASWVRPETRGLGGGNGPAVTPGLQLAALDVDLPLSAAALETIVANLVGNAAAAARTAADPRVLVRVEESQDAAGRRLVTFLVADSAPSTVALEQIEQRDGQRGLGIVRDLVRRWGGHLVVRAEAAPFRKAIGAAFPIPRAEGG